MCWFWSCLLKESCARILLYRGAKKETKNNNGQTPFQVRVECVHDNCVRCVVVSLCVITFTAVKNVMAWILWAIKQV